MQTTLLGIAITLILALVVALVGPLLVDWDQYRDEFEARAGSFTGLEFKIAGAIDARLLPTPSLILQNIEFGRRGEPGKVRARALRIEFALGSLMRGEWKIADARLEGPEVALGLDGSGRLALPMPSGGVAPEGVMIQQLSIENGRAILTDAASGSRLVLEKLEFKGEVRSLAGPAKGEGSFVLAGQHYPYRLSASRVGDDGSVKLRMTVDPIDRPIAAEADLSVAIERGIPRYEGSLTLARPVGRAPEGGAALIVEPWRLTSQIKGDSRAAVLEQIEFQYGPDDRAIKLRGAARLTLGGKPQLSGELSSPAVDLDRILALPEATRRQPLAAIKTFAEQLTGTVRLPLPARFAVNVETLTLAEATLQRVAAELASDGESWNIEALDLRAPGITQVRLNGRLGGIAKGIGFKGQAKIDAGDPRALFAWLTSQADASPAVTGALRISGGLTLSSEEIAVDGLKAELDRMTIAGRFGYRWATGDRPARIDAELAAPEIDVDRVHALGKAVFDSTGFDWPREGRLSLKIARASIAGVEAKQADIDMRIDANGVDVERFAIADFGGATLAVKGRINAGGQSPHGAITLDLDARGLDGITALVATVSPRAAEELRRSSARVTPLTLRASLAVEPAVERQTSVARFKADGRSGAFRIALEGNATAPSRAFTSEHLPMLKAARAAFTGRFESDDGRALVEFVGLDRFLAVDKQPGRMNVSVSGPLDGTLAVDGQLVAGALNLAASGTTRLPQDASATAALAVRMANASLRSLRPAASGAPAPLLPATLSAKLALADRTVTLTELTGSVANTGVAGRLAIGLAHPTRIDGELELGALDVPAALAAAVGMPASAPNANELWPAEPFEGGLLRDVQGEIKIKATRAMLTPKLLARDVRGVLHVGEAELGLHDVEAEVAGGRMTGELQAERRAEGLAARGRIRFTGADAAELLPGDGVLSGRITLDLAAQGSGRSATALIGSLDGTGSFMLENGRIERLDPAIFEALMRAADAGLPMDAVRVRTWIEKALAGNALPVTLAEGAITIAAGQARLSNTIVHTRGTDLAASGSFNLADGTIDARLALSGAAGLGGVANSRPELAIALKGPLAAPRRTIDVAALSTWLALRSVEQQSKKLDILEGRAPAEPAAPKEAHSPAAPARTVTPPPPTTAPPAAARAEPEPPAPRPKPPVRAPQRPRPAEQARPAPPPINILPFFAPRS